VWPAQRRAESLELAETAVSTGVEPDFAEIRTDLFIAACLQLSMRAQPVYSSAFHRSNEDCADATFLALEGKQAIKNPRP
jgi:hypothetical protein